MRLPVRSAYLRHLPALVLALAAPAYVALCSDAPSVKVSVDRPGHAISPLLWGIFFEDINLSADGGIYPELVRNRSFEDSEKPDPWSLVTSGSARSEISTDDSRPLNPLNRRSLRWRIADVGDGKVGLANGGYFGMAVKEGATYRLSLSARSADGFDGKLSAAVEAQDGRRLAEGSIEGIGEGWKGFALTLKARGTDPAARLVLTAASKGTVWLDMVSLFPEATWKGRPNGLRPDLCEMLAGLKPSFVRFPGGCWVEGHDLARAYRWKNTIGDVAHRIPLWNIWQYNATHGLGYHEYLQMSEDLGAEPLFVVNCGMSHTEVVPMDQMATWVQDALDAIEYANGPVESVWGGLRARNGHPAPFGLKYIEIGNENGGPAYQERYPLFHDAIRARYPDMIIISDVPTERRRSDVVDEHYYSNPGFFMQQADRYDGYDRTGPKIYVGEYAVTQGCGQGNLRGAIGEAAFMTGMERNSDIVAMASYAPLFANVHYKKWNPDLINFDSSRVYGLPSYYVQKMFSEHRGDVVLPVDVDAPIATEEAKGGAIGVGTWATQAEFKDIKVTRGGETLFAADFTRGTEGWKLLGGEWKVEGGALRQGALADNIRAIAGDAGWRDYTYSLKARKLGGSEGFLIIFRLQDENQKAWWNLGGWGNQRHAVEMGGVIGNEVPGRIETGKWYDIRIELSGSKIRCFLDGKLIHDVKYPSMRSLYACASREKASGDVILKVVNASAEALETKVSLEGLAGVRSPARAIVLTSEKSTDENSLEEPTKVAPVERKVEVKAPAFMHAFPGNSLTILRLGAER